MTSEPITRRADAPSGSSFEPDLRAIFVLTAGLVAVHAVLRLAGIWKSWAWPAIGVTFVLLVIICERIGRIVPAKARSAYELSISLGFPVVLLCTWQLGSDMGLINPVWFPPPTKIAEALWQVTVGYDRFSQTSLLGRPWLIPHAFQDGGVAGVVTLLSESHVLATVMRVLVGFVFGAVPGILLGVVMGVNQTVRLMLDTTLSAVYVLPKIAIFPIVMLMFADPFGEGPKIVVVALSVFILMAINTMTGVRNIDPVYLMAGKNYGANSVQMLRHVILPGALPVIFAGLRIALGTAMIVIISVEFLRAKQGVGYMTYYYWEVLVPEKMYAGLAVVMAMGVIFTATLYWLERQLMPWKK
jgi:ABC-type nitrate/sulfonate/bicarbonate transport system permease component